MIKYKIENIGSSVFFLKEFNKKLPSGREYIFPNDTAWEKLANAQSIKDGLIGGTIDFYRDDANLSTIDAITYLTLPSPPGSGEVNTASNTGTGAGIFKQKIVEDLELRSISSSDLNIVEGTNEIEIQAQPQLITNYASVTPISGMFVLVEDSGTLRSVDISNFLGSVTQVADEEARDLAFPSPADGFQVFNLRQGVVETYSTTFDLWLSSCMNVCVEDTTVQTVAVQKAVFITTTAATIGGVEFPVLNYVASSGDRNVTHGVVTRKGAATGNPNETYVAVHHFGVYYIDYSAAITIGFNVYPNTAGTGDVIGAAFAQSGTLGQAIENSGSNPSYPSSVLVSLQNRR